MKNLITIILSFLFISYSFSDTIKYREKKLFRDYEDKVVTDVEFLGVYKYFVCYRFPTKYLGNDIKTIKCEDVYEISIEMVVGGYSVANCRSIPNFFGC